MMAELWFQFMQTYYTLEIYTLYRAVFLNLYSFPFGPPWIFTSVGTCSYLAVRDGQQNEKVKCPRVLGDDKHTYAYLLGKCYKREIKQRRKTGGGSVFSGASGKSLLRSVYSREAENGRVPRAWT